MINEVYFTVTVTKTTKSTRETREFTKLFDSDHPSVLDKTVEQYGYKDIVKMCTDIEKVFEQRCDYLELPKILRAVNGKPTVLKSVNTPVESCT